MSDETNKIMETIDQLVDRFKTMINLSNLDQRLSDYLIYDLNELKKTIGRNRNTKYYAKECLIAMELDIRWQDYEMDELHDVIINTIKSRLNTQNKNN
jgi:hypothetical protein